MKYLAPMKIPMMVTSIPTLLATFFPINSSNEEDERVVDGGIAVLVAGGGGGTGTRNAGGSITSLTSVVSISICATCSGTTVPAVFTSCFSALSSLINSIS